MKSHSTARASAIRSIRVAGWWGGQSASSECARSARVLVFVIVSPKANSGSCRDRRPVICGCRFLVAVPPGSDLLLRAKHLFVAAMVVVAAGRRGRSEKVCGAVVASATAADRSCHFALTRAHVVSSVPFHRELDQYSNCSCTRCANCSPQSKQYRT